MQRRRPRERILLQLDFGGPIVDDRLIENTRRQTAMKTARESGVLSAFAANAARKSPALANFMQQVSLADFRAAYKQGKETLKADSSGAEAYDDINRTAATLLEAARAKNPSLVSGLSYKDITAGINKKRRMAFFRRFAGPVERAAYKSINSELFSTIAGMMQKAKAGGIKIRIDVVTDNNPILYRTAFQKAISSAAREYAKEAGRHLPKIRYRRRPKTMFGKAVRATTLLLSPAGKSRVYISGESWGNKKNPETWKRILKDRDVEKGEKVIFVDDSLKKLRGFHEGTTAFGAQPVAVWLDLKKEAPINLQGTATSEGFRHFTIHSIRQLLRIQ
jgi:hypothetical protein